MAARAIWKGSIRIGNIDLPVKLYSAVQDRTVHFRLLHRTDHEPVRQKMLDAETGEEVEYQKTQKAFPAGRGRLVKIDREELAELEPKESRDIEVTRFVDPADIDHRWYERAYYLGPDGNEAAYFAAAEALERKGKEGVARWVMRKKEYVGALRADGGYLLLITLRHADEIVDAQSLDAPEGRPLQERELGMAQQLIEGLTDTFDPTQWQDTYRARVMELVETKAAGRKPKVTTFRPKKTDDDTIGKALEASLKGLKKASNG